MASLPGLSRVLKENQFSDRPTAGDLIFVLQPPAEASAMEQAITASTHVHLPITHVALAVNDSVIIEAAPQRGVDTTHFEAFMAENPYLIVKRCPSMDTEASIRSALSYVGRLYDWAYQPDDTALYCSELIQLSCVDNQGQRIFGTQPMNFQGADGRIDPYWTQLFERLHRPVPQGVAGTNPAALAADGRLLEIWRRLPNY